MFLKMKYFIMQKTGKNFNLQFCSKLTTHDFRQATTNINTELYVQLYAST